MSGPPQDPIRPWITVDQPQIAPSLSPAHVVHAPVMTPPASTTTAASRKRGCNCKKSGCLKLYCECFAANMRCGERCQCMGCKNKEHNRLEIAHAIQAIEKRTQKAFRSPATVARKLEHFRNTPVVTVNPLAPQAAVPVLPSSSFLVQGAAAFAPAAIAAGDHAGAHSHSHHHAHREACACRGGICTSECPCLVRFGGCEPSCPCKGCQPLQQEKAKGCSCKKSNCLKLYCECLAAQRVCDSRCNCEGCKNRPENQSERDRAVAAILERNPLAFQPKVANGSSQHLRGCNCRKSGCMKNYCECHQAGVPCTSRCACHQCRNTEMFVSAKKMLVFKGPEDGSSNEGKLGFDHHQHHQHPQRAKSSNSSASARRVYRKSSFDSPPQTHELAPHVYTPARAQNPSAALELLSRSAPAAPRPTSFLRATTPSKRAHAADASASQLHHPRERPLVSSLQATAAAATNFTKRKYSKVSSRPLFVDRIQEAAGGAGAHSEDAALPSVEKTIEQEFGSGDGAAAAEPSLATLCRSLLRAAMTVDSASPARQDDDHNEVQAGDDKSDSSTTTAKLQRRISEDMVSDDVCMSPVAEDLLCAEDIETPGETTTASSSQEDDQQLARDDSSNIRVRQAAKDRNLIAAAQERAVLQEVSVWLRNITTAALPNGNTSSSRRF